MPFFSSSLGLWNIVLTGLWMPLSTVHFEAGWSQRSLSSFCVGCFGCCCIILLPLKRWKDVWKWLKHPPDIDVYWMIWYNITLCSILSPYCSNDRQVSVLLLTRNQVTKALKHSGISTEVPVFQTNILVIAQHFEFFPVLFSCENRHPDAPSTTTSTYIWLKCMKVSLYIYIYLCIYIYIYFSYSILEAFEK